MPEVGGLLLLGAGNSVNGLALFRALDSVSKVGDVLLLELGKLSD